MKEAPDWLKQTRAQLEERGRLRTTAINEANENRKRAEQELSQKWKPLHEKILNYAETWKSLGVDRIFQDIAIHVYDDLYSGNPELWTENQLGRISLVDSQGEIKDVGGSSGQVLDFLVSLGRNGLQPEEVQFAYIQTEIYHTETYGGGPTTDDPPSSRKVVDRVIRLTKGAIALLRANGEEEIRIPLEELKSSQDLERKLNSFLGKQISESVTKEKLELVRKRVKEKILEIAIDLQIPKYLNSLNPPTADRGHLAWHHPTLHLVNANLGEIESIEQGWGDYLEIPNEIINWLRGQPALVYTVWATGDARRESYFFVTITDSGRVGILQKDGTIFAKNRAELKPGGKGFGAENQTNPQLEQAIQKVAKEPPITIPTKNPARYRPASER